MRILFKKIFIFIIPFMIYGAVVVIVDPYDYFGVSKIVDDRIKENTSYKLNYTLWKQVQYLSDPVPNILIGDSRMENLGVDNINAVSQHKYFDFSYGGASLPEIIDTFWFAEKKSDLKKIVIGINFYQYNEFYDRNRFSESQEIIAKPYLYFIDTSVVRAILYNLIELMGIKKFKIERPKMTQEEFWEYQISVSARRHYEKYKYPSGYYSSLKKIAEYCKRNNIEISFLIFPEHVDIITEIKKYGLLEEYKKFKEDISAIGRTFDLDDNNSMKLDRNNFTDPYHLNRGVNIELVKEIFQIKRK